jgi:glutamyl-tRNA reductase
MATRSSTLVALSATHHTAGLDARAAFALPEGGADRFYAAAREAGLAEVVLLATCNRLEAYALGDEAAALHLRTALAHAAGGGAESLDAHLRPVPGLAAVEHLFGVAAGLDSQMVGEVEIGGQVKEAYADALARGMTGPVLNRIFQRAFQAAAWARTHTGISQGQVSLGNVAVELAERAFGSLADARVLVLGTGDAGRRVSQALVSRGARDLTVASRTFANAATLAGELSGAAIELATALAQTHAHDIVVGCSQVERPLLAAGELAAQVARRHGRPLLLIDLGVPRNIDPEARGVDGVYLADLDDLAAVANANQRTRLTEAERARAALAERAARAFATALPSPPHA